MDLDFERNPGTGIESLIPHASYDCIDVIYRLLEYDEEVRISAREALKHPFFKEMREQDALRESPSPYSLTMPQHKGDPERTGFSVKIVGLQREPTPNSKVRFEETISF